MKKLVMAASLLVVAAVAFSTVYAAATSAAVVNKKCPVKKSDLKEGGPSVDVICKDKTTASVGVCCNNCAETYKKDVTKYPVPELKANPAVKAARP